MKQLYFLLPPSAGRKKVATLLPSGADLYLELEAVDWGPGTVLDTFENQVTNTNRMLLQAGNQLMLFAGAAPVLTQNVVSGWRLATDLDPGPVADILLKLSRLRAFLPVSEFSLREQQGRLLDDERKTRARLTLYQCSRGSERLQFGCTEVLRGYEADHNFLVQALEQAGADCTVDLATIYTKLGGEDYDYSSKPQLSLTPDGEIREAARAIIASCIGLARRNEAGVIADYDTEFLHDYRVSLRKVRSVLSLFKGVFDGSETIRLKGEFGGIMKATNRMRDLDVYLLEENNYKQLVPEPATAGLGHLFIYLARERAKEYQVVAQELESRGYQERMADLETLFNQPGALPAGPAGSQPSLAYANALIMKRYRKVCKIARTIDADTEDEVVHNLRINCKKLRYLMEFFAPLYPAKEIKQLIKALKKLQDNLGAFNDYSVQQEFLQQVIDQNIKSFRARAVSVAEAIGALTAMLNGLQQRERDRIMESFTEFDSNKTQDAFFRLFYGEDK